MLKAMQNVVLKKKFTQLRSCLSWYCSYTNYYG